MSNNDFESYINDIMSEISNKLIGEVWEDIKNILRFEQEFVSKNDEETAQVIKLFNDEIGNQLELVLEFAAPETEERFWEELDVLRQLIEVVDLAIDDIHQIDTAARSWIRPYVLGFLLGCQERGGRIE